MTDFENQELLNSTFYINKQIGSHNNEVKHSPDGHMTRLMTTPHLEFDELHFSKEYVSAFGNNVYLQKKIKLNGVASFNYNAEYKTITMKIDEETILFLNELNRCLVILDLPVVKMTTHETFGTQIYVKCKKDSSLMNVMKGENLKIDTTLSVFTDKRGKQFSSLII